MARSKRPAIDRLMDKVREDEDGCWIFEGYRDKQGYGQIRDGGRLKSVHRVSYESFNGPCRGSHYDMGSMERSG